MEKYLYQDLYELEENHWWHIAKRETCLNLINRFIHKDNYKILDIGCGAGKNMEYFRQIGRCYGIDSSKEAIKFCVKRGLQNISLQKAQKTIFSKDSFDLITMLDVLEHIDEYSSLQEIRRILKNKGYLLITVPSYSFLWSKWDELLHHKRRYTKKSLIKILQQNRFEVIHISYMYPHLLIPMIIVRIIKHFLHKNAYGSDFHLINPLINQILLYIARIQIPWITHLSIPIGTSIICLAQKNE